jgi:hypothetical protein
MSISGVIDTWNATSSIVFESVKADSFGYTAMDFFVGM